MKPGTLRWAIATLIILISAITWYNVWEIANVFMSLHYFFCGILLADLYCCNGVLYKNQKLNLCNGVASLAAFLFLDAFIFFGAYLLKLVCMFLLFHAVLTNMSFRKVFSTPLITSIGGMCYSVYLMHFAVVAAVGYLLINAGLPLAISGYVIPFYLLFITAVLVVSGIYFLLVEKPFMKPWGFEEGTSFTNKVAGLFLWIFSQQTE